jgi:hypothetical protein
VRVLVVCTYEGCAAESVCVRACAGACVQVCTRVRVLACWSRSQRSLTRIATIVTLFFCHAGAIWQWAGSVPSNGSAVLDGLQKEIDRVARLQVADVNNAAEELRLKAQEKLTSMKPVAAGSEFLPFLRSMRAEADVRAVCRYVHFVVYKTDDKVGDPAVRLSKDSSASVRRGIICAHVEATIALASPAAHPVLNGETRQWELPPFAVE